MERAGAWVVVAIGLMIVAAIAYFGLKRTEPPPTEPPRAAAPAPEAVPEQAAPRHESGPQIRYPAPTEQKGAQAPQEGEAGLWNAVVGLLGDKSLEALLNRQDFVPRVVATVDNLPRRKLPQRLTPVKLPGGTLVVIGEGNNAVLSPANAARYERYLRLMEAVDTRTLLDVYARYYPLFQQAFRELGYPNGYFNDRVVEVIDDMLAAPELREAARLDQPKVYYIFEDPALEALSAGQKMLIRIGPLNAAKAKAKLREIRKELVSQTGKQMER